MAKSAVVLAVGASPRGQASHSTPMSMTMSLCFAKLEFLLPVKAIMLQPIRRMTAAMRAIAAGSGTPLVDLGRVFETICPELLCPEWLYEDQHPRVAGYRLVAETINERLPELLGEAN